MGGGGGSSSSNSSTTTSTDKRQVVEGGSLGVSSDSSTVYATMADYGAIAGAGQAVKDALDVVKAGDATLATSFEKVLTVADKMFTGGLETLKASNANVSHAYQTAREIETNRGTLDNKTITIIAVAGAAALAFIAKKGKA
jgi:hypothetical protein